MRRFSAFVVCLAALSCPAIAQSQDSTFTVSSYIPDYFRDFEWTIDGSFNLSGFANSSDGYNYISMSTHRSFSTASGNLALGTRLMYRAETRRHVVTATLPLSVSGSIRSDRSEEMWPQSLTEERFIEAEEDSRRWSITAQPAVQADVYLSRLVFTRLKARSYLRYDESPESEAEQEKRESHLSDGYTVLTHSLGYSSGSYSRPLYSVSASAGLGVGRIWEGQYASTALYIVEEMRRNGVLLREPTFDEMTSLADTIRYFRLVHPIDTRLLRLEALSTILSMLQSTGVVGDVGPYGVYMIQDVWDYFPRKSRGFGATASIGVGGDFTHSRNDNSFTGSYLREIKYDHPDTIGYQAIDTLTSGQWHNDSYNREMARGYYYFDAAWSRPLSRQWQFNALGEGRVIVHYKSEEDSYRRYSASGDTSTIREEHLTVENREVYWDIGLSTELLYLYDSRTALAADLNYTFVERITSQPYLNDSYWMYVDRSDKNRHRVSAAFTALYRLSVPTTLQGNAVFIYDNFCRTTTKITQTDWSLSLAIKHYLF